MSLLRAVILIEQGFQDEEFVYPRYRMLEEGFEVIVASIRGEEVRGKYGVPAPVSHKIAQAPDADLVFIPGGWQCPERLRMNEQVLAYVRRAHSQGVCIAAICHGPQVLISAGIVKGRRMTGYVGIRDDLVNAGAIYPVDTVMLMDEAAVVRDGNIITAQHYNDGPAFMREVIAYMRTVQPKAYADSPHAI